MTNERHVAVVGAGITGLAAGYELRKAFPDLKVTVFEQSDRTGGKIITETVEDFVIEGGPDSFVTDKPWCLNLCRELGLEDRLVPCNTEAQRVYILRQGRLVRFPGGLRLTIPTQFGPFLRSDILPWSAKLRMLGDVVLPRGKVVEDESLASFIGRRFGRECLEGLAGPMMSGIYVSDPQRMSMRATFPTFLAMERDHRSLILAARRAKRAVPPGKKPPAMFQSLRGGMGELSHVLRQRLESDLCTRARVESMTADAAGLTLQVHADGAVTRPRFSHVLLTVPAGEAARLIEPHHAELGRALRAIRYVSTATVSLAYADSDLPPGVHADGFGALIPAREGRRIIAFTWSSTKFPGRAPEGHRLLRVFVGGSTNEADAELPEAELLDLVCNELRDIIGLTAPPRQHRLYRWIKGNPQYDVGHPARVAHIHDLTAEVPGLFLAGSAYHGIGMPDCIHDAQRAVGEIRHSLEGHAPA